MWNARSRLAWALAIGTVLVVGLTTSRRAEAAPPAVVYHAKELTKQQFDRLPDGAVIEARGKRFTAGELRARARRNAAAFKADLTPLNQARPSAEVLKSRFLQTQKAKLNAENAKLRARFASLHRVRKPLGALAPTPTDTVPVITQIVGTVTPGAALYIKGRNFGYDGEVLLRGLPQGIVVLPLDSNNYLFPWLSDGVAVVVPDITGINDQAGSIQVNVRNSLGSREVPVTFYATDVVVFNVDVALLNCNQDATENRCDNTHGSFFGLHTENTLWEEDALGCDQWAFALHNGWTVYSSFYFTGSVGGEAGSTFHPAKGSTHYEWQICWSVNGAGPYSGNSARYGGDLDIVGHLGVPW